MKSFYVMTSEKGKLQDQCSLSCLPIGPFEKSNKNNKIKIYIQVSHHCPAQEVGGGGGVDA